MSQLRPTWCIYAIHQIEGFSAPQVCCVLGSYAHQHDKRSRETSLSAVSDSIHTAFNWRQHACAQDQVKLYYRCSHNTELPPLRTYYNLTLQTSHHSEAVFAYTTLLSIYNGCQLGNCLFQLAVLVDHNCSTTRESCLARK